MIDGEDSLVDLRAIQLDIEGLLRLWTASRRILEKEKLQLP